MMIIVYLYWIICKRICNFLIDKSHFSVDVLNYSIRAFQF